MLTLGRQMVKMTSAMASQPRSPKALFGPDAAGVVHDVVQTAEARDHAADAGGHDTCSG